MFSRILFYFLAALSIPIIISIINSLAGGRRRSALMTLRVYLIVVAVYCTVLVATTLALPIETLPVNAVQYSGDWSITVASLRRNPHGLDEDYEVDFRLSDRGTKPVHGDKNLIVYLLGEDGTRYNPAPEPSTPPVDVIVNPGRWLDPDRKTKWSDRSVTTTRKFVLPTNLNRVELVIAHQGFQLSWFIVGRSPLDGRTVIELQ